MARDLSTNRFAAQNRKARHDFAIIGFEGDPARPLAERRAKHCPLRDVASMLRSFGYAAHDAMRHGSAHTDAERERVSVPLAQWHQATTESFYGAYRERMQGVASMPPPAVAASLLDAFVVEGALHEFRSSLKRRPEWAEVPLQAIARILLTTSTAGVA